MPSLVARGDPAITRSYSDVLVVGGGFAGLWAAYRAAQLGRSVVLVDKATAARSGASTMSGGVTTAPIEGDDLDAWFDEIVIRSGYTTNQHWTRQLLHGQVDRLRDLETFGVPITRNPDGSIKRLKSRGMIDVRCCEYLPRRAIEALRARAESAGVQIVDRMMGIDLITSDGQYPTSGRVCGLMAIGTRTADLVAFYSPCVIIASGLITLKGSGRSVVENLTGDGAAMAFRAGARLVDIEFGCGGTFSIVNKYYSLGSFNLAVAHGAQLINSRGERFMQKYDPVRLERSELSRVVAAFAREMLDSNGPVRLDLATCDPAYWTMLARIGRNNGSALLTDAVPDPQHVPPLIEPAWAVWSVGSGGVQIDRHCATNLPGLLAAGSAARNEAVGRHSSAGTPTAFAFVSGHTAGEAAARRDEAADLPARSDEAEQRALRRVAALGREGVVTVDDVHNQIATIAGSNLIDLLILDSGKIARTLDRLSEAEQLLAAATVDSPHELVKYLEASSSLDVVRAMFECMGDRTESRESFYRADFPFTDDLEWLCWHTIERTATGSRLARDAIPFDQYPLRPADRQRYLSPVAAILRGDYQSSVYQAIGTL